MISVAESAGLSGPLGGLVETRVCGSAAESQGRIGGAGWISSTTRWGCGHVYDGTAAGRLVGLDYAWNRYYSSTWGRFTSADPYVMSGGLGNPQGWNRYSYADNQPTTLYDPRGLQAQAPKFTCEYGREGTIVDCYWYYDPGPAGPGFGDSDPRPEPPTDTLSARIAASKSRAKARVSDTIHHPKCAKELGLDDPNGVADILEATAVGESNMGIIRLDDAGAPLKGQAMATAVFGGAITFNGDITWSSPNTTPAIMPDGSAVTYDLLAAMSAELKTASMTAEIFMDFIMLHELGHVFGHSHGPSTAEYNKGIWEKCFN